MRAACERQAIVWDAIERLAFRPSAADRQGWLRRYVLSLRTIWGVEPTNISIRSNNGFDAWFLGVACDYAIEAPDRYSVTIVNAATQAPACWYTHVDPDYRSRSSFFQPREDYPTQDLATHLERDVETVLDGMIFHPCNHAHGNEIGIVSALGGASALSSEKIRLGGGIENGFVFLTHLRYQFCLLSNEARQAERARLIRLFTAAIQAGGRVTVPPSRLFDLSVQRP